MIIKVKGSAIDVTTANTVSSAKLVRCFASSAATVTITNDDGDTLGTFKMPQNTVEYVEKAADDKIASTSALSCTPVSYKTM